MNKQVAFVLKGFTELNSVQRNEFIEEINKYLKDKSQQQPIEESIRKSIPNAINFGPTPAGCPCCGR